VYSDPRVPDSNAFPGARLYISCWTDKSGNFWLYGGITSGNYLGDTWRFDGTNWTFWAGTTGTNAAPYYGDPKTFSFDYHPGARDRASIAVTSSGSVYLVGGRGMSIGETGDIWKFESYKGWAFWGGAVGSHPVTPGTIRVPSSTNRLGGRAGVQSVVDDLDNIWIFGGSGNVPGVTPNPYGIPLTQCIYSSR
jgi:hypothetical protein